MQPKLLGDVQKIVLLIDMIKLDLFVDKRRDNIWDSRFLVQEREKNSITESFMAVEEGSYRCNSRQREGEDQYTPAYFH